MWNVVQNTYARDERGRMRLKGVAEYQFTDQQKQECINAITFFRRLNGKEKWDGTTLESISPDNNYKIVRIFQEVKE